MRAFLLSSLLVAASVAGPVDLARGQIDRLDGSIASRTYDFGALRFEQPEAFAALKDQVEDHLESEAAALRALPRPSQCAPDLPDQLARFRWMELAQASPDVASLNEDTHGLRERLTAIRAAADALAAGSTAVDARVPLSQLDHLIQARAGATDARLRDLFSHALRDQTLRLGLGGDATSGWRSGLSPRAEAAWRGVLSALVVETDCRNTAWLQEQLREITWFDRRTHGDAADDAAWLLVLHADWTPAIQAQSLRVLERLVDDGGTRGSNFAFLSDRVALGDGRPQRFGTQVACLDGKIAPIGGLEAPEGIDARRAAVGLETFASHRAMMAQRLGCPDPG